MVWYSESLVFTRFGRPLSACVLKKWTSKIAKLYVCNFLILFIKNWTPNLLSPKPNFEPGSFQTYLIAIVSVASQNHLWWELVQRKLTIIWWKTPIKLVGVALCVIFTILVSFLRDNALFASKAKINVVWNFLQWLRRSQRSEKKFQTTLILVFEVWDNRASTQSTFLTFSSETKIMKITHSAS